jgi:hypothetical protein
VQRNDRIKILGVSVAECGRPDLSKISSTATIDGRNIAPMSKIMIPLRLELRTACVLDRSDNQLHHRTIDVKISSVSEYNLCTHLQSVRRLLPRRFCIQDVNVDHLSRTASNAF